MLNYFIIFLNNFSLVATNINNLALICWKPHISKSRCWPTGSSLNYRAKQRSQQFTSGQLASVYRHYNSSNDSVGHDYNVDLLTSLHDRVNVCLLASLFNFASVHMRLCVVACKFVHVCEIVKYRTLCSNMLH